MLRFVALSTSRGTVFEAIVEQIREGKLSARCIGLITTKLTYGCREKALNAGVPLVIVERRKDEPREEFDKRMHTAILELEQQDEQKYGGPSRLGTLVLCLGWMLLLSKWFTDTWSNRILNIHPSLLPKYRGAHALEDALQAKETETGMTIHMVDEQMDTGKILVQKSCSIFPDDTLETLKAREQALEKEWFPKTLAMIERGEMKL